MLLMDWPLPKVLGSHGCEERDMFWKKQEKVMCLQCSGDRIFF